MSSDLLSVIGHYQRSIERSASDEARLLHCIDKLYRLPVTVEHLQATGVGKTVNSLRKYDKEVGIAAKALVAKWKAMVAAEEDDEPEQQEQNCNRRRSQGDDSVHDNNNHQHAASTTTRTDSNRNSSQNQSRHNGHSSHTQSRDRMEQKINERRNEKERLENEVRNKHNKRSSSSHRSNYEENKYEKNENYKINRTENEDRRRDDTSKRLKGNDIKLPDLPETLNIDDESGEDDDEEKLIIDVTKEIKVKLDDSKRKRESRSPSKHNHHKDNDHHSPKDNKEKKDKHKEKDKIRKAEKSHKDESSSERNKRKEKDHNSKHKDYDSHRSKHKEKKQEKEKDESSSSHRSNGEHRHKNKEKDKKRKDGEENKSEEIKKEKHKRRNSDSDSKLSDVSPPKPKVPKVLVDGIDSSMGTSFEDALGMMFSPSKKSRSPKASTSSSSATSTTVVKPAASKPVKESKESKQTPALLSSAVKLEPLDPTLMLDIPIISPNYKPMPLNPTVMDCVFSATNKIAAPPPPRRMLTDEEAMSVGISSKTMRTKVYSGIKTGALLQVTSLFDLCIRVLQKNIDALEYTGGVPFEVLRPVLERANPQQLVNFEEFNPYLMEDSDILWQQHCIRYYRGKKRIEMETWREMFMRCKEEQDLKLSLLAENIKQSQKQIALPVRKTQLAYVDSMVKPPRNIQRKQEQYGTKGKLAATPAARVAALSGITPNVAKAGDNRLKIVSNERDTAQATSHSRPKKAPLMQKTLQFMKGRFKR